MKTIVCRFIIFIVFFFFYCSLKSEPVQETKTVGQYSVLFELKDLQNQNKWFHPDFLAGLEHLLNDIIQFEKEIYHLNISKNHKLEFHTFDKNNKTLESFQIHIFFNRQSNRPDIIHEIHQTRENSGKLLKYYKTQRQTYNGTIHDIFHIYNFCFDENNQIKTRAILKTTDNFFLNAHADFEKFIEGTRIEYNYFNKSPQPSSSSFKTFILSKSGQTQIIKAKESLNCVYNENGNLMRETIRETQYSYRDFQKNYALFNVYFHDDGNLQSFDLIYTDKMNEPVRMAQDNYHLSFDLFFNSYPIQKTIKSFELVLGQKVFKKGTILKIIPHEKLLIASSEETDFLINPGTTGMNDTERRYQTRTTIFNLTFDHMNVILKKYLKTRYFYPDPDNSEKSFELFDSMRQINFTYNQKNRLKHIHASYFAFTEDKILSIIRTVTINILEYMKNGDPFKIELSITSALEPDSNFAQTIVQDCNYIINEACFGSLFEKPVKNNYDVHLTKISEKGNLLEWEILEKQENKI